MSMKFFLVCVFAIATIATGSDVVDPYGKLTGDLFKDYDPTARPGTPTEGITVDMRLTIISIDLKEHESSFLVNAWIPMQWEDKRLQWNPEEYSGISVVRVPPTKVWTPDLSIYFEVPSSSQVAGPEKLLLIFNNGTVLWVPIVLFKQQCQLDLRTFPADEQHCKVQVGSWTYDTKEVDMKLWEPAIILDAYAPSGEWSLVESKAEKRDDVYPNIEGSYASLVYNFKVQRRVSPYCISLYAPVFACVFAAIASLFAARNGPSSKSEHIIISLLTTSILLIVAVYHGYAMKVSVTGLPNIFKFIGFLVVLEALFLPIKGLYVSVTSAMQNELSAKYYGMKPLPRCVATMIGAVPFIGNKQGSEMSYNECEKLVEAMSEDCKKNVADWKRFTDAVWVSMLTTYLFALCALIFAHFAY